MTTVAPIMEFPPLKLDYRYEFQPHELDAIKACHDDHGFAIVKGMLSATLVEQLKDSVSRVANPKNDLCSGQTRVITDFIENSPPLVSLLELEPYLRIYRHILGSDRMTVHRSAAILRNPGSPTVTWHSDWTFYDGPPRTANETMNRGEFPSGFWFYLNGTHPSRGGLAVIVDSHRIDWKAPEGFEFTANRVSFHRKGEPAAPYAGMDVPGMLALYTDPGDMIIFGARTYHAAFPHGGTEPRLSCAIIFRPGQALFPVGWPLPESARRLKETIPARLRPFVEHYTGFDRSWKPAV